MFTPDDSWCDDGIDCTREACDPILAGCVFTPDDSLCDDGLFCTGIETCDPISGCQPGLPPDCNDNDLCTVDTCDTLTDACAHELIDQDGDGFCDDDDTCPSSDMSETVVIGECDSGVDNWLFGDGCTMSDAIAACAENAANHGAFVSCVAHLTNQWKRDGLISGSEKGWIQRCAARAHIGSGNNKVRSRFSNPGGAATDRQ